MKDYDSQEEREKRASQEDPIVMYLIVHETLDMSTGKTAAQCAHASQMLTLQYFHLKEFSKQTQKEIIAKPDAVALDRLKLLYANMAPFISIMGEWLQGSFRKVVLKADDKEWNKLKEEFKDKNMVLVVDAGLTEIPSGSETVIGLWPMRKSQVPKTVKRLQVLK
jgi:PTH2 family peptidyl-tRNA hydrolase